MSTTTPRYIPKNDDADQVCVFINKAANLNFLCLGKVGKSQRFCLAQKDPPFSHCGVVAHAKKFWPETRTYYVPGGIVSGTCPTAKWSRPFTRITFLSTCLKDSIRKCFRHEDGNSLSQNQSQRAFARSSVCSGLVSTSVFCAVQESTQNFCTLTK